MAESFNVYCDDICRLEGDDIRFMSNGCVWCITRVYRMLNRNMEAVQ